MNGSWPRSSFPMSRPDKLSMHPRACLQESCRFSAEVLVFLRRRREGFSGNICPGRRRHRQRKRRLRAGPPFFVGPRRGGGSCGGRRAQYARDGLLDGPGLRRDHPRPGRGIGRHHLAGAPDRRLSEFPQRLEAPVFSDIFSTRRESAGRNRPARWAHGLPGGK